MNIAVLGLGEAGSHFANGLAKLGFNVFGWDPIPKRVLHKSVNFAKSNLEAAQNADIIFSVNLTSVSEEVATEVLPCLNEKKIYAELNTSSPGKKQIIYENLRTTGIQFADVAIMAPVPPKGIFTPMLTSGPGAIPLADIMQPFGLSIIPVDGNVGQAALLKLLRSIVYKGIAAVICEAMDAGMLFGQEKYIREQICSIIGGQDELIDRFVEGSRTHAIRRIHEMDAVVEMLMNKGINPVMSEATKENLQKLAGS
ncbi:NAD(P)-dependent oxidoreductase [Mucilaginibacter flavidus]|uniref:NAD(P)-dependent oxidoreductase n=1 Tax=Mucilaginibacter flavidus TaxID=2949309 RepID=UPI002093F910|nr:NAD(P)-dependent oxidoreductase [Mucilaginibacter flavidus]MCO5949359.1 NAD(P)-binding domain-containing protein [Mucilaginibacter flavidus]